MGRRRSLQHIVQNKIGNCLSQGEILHIEMWKHVSIRLPIEVDGCLG
jgi:hypothetical protein